MESWHSIMDFFRRLSSSSRDEYSQYGSHMLEFLKQLSMSSELDRIGAHLEGNQIAIYNEDITSRRVYVVWENGSYKISLNEFVDSEVVDKTHIVQAVKQYLKQIRDNSSAKANETK